MRRAVFVDRDGVLNRALIRDGRPFSPGTLDEWEVLPGAADAVGRLRAAGFLVIVITNQPDVAEGRTPRPVMEAIHGLLLRDLGVDDIKVCDHTDADACLCRKPLPGMIEQAAEEWSIDVEKSYMVGDRWRDIGAGRAAGCTTVLVGDGYQEPKMAEIEPDLIVASFAEGCDLILARLTPTELSHEPLSDLRIKIFADGADLPSIADLSASRYVSGFTTNPTLMRKARVADYCAFAHDVLALVTGRPVSFEVFSDDFDEMERQAREIASWAENVYVKIPVSDTSGRFSGRVIRRLTETGARVNVTAITTVQQVEAVSEHLCPGVPSLVSVFAGRIADTGRDPVPIMRECLTVVRKVPEAELLWASPREVLNIVQADAIGCDVITVTAELLAKLPLLGKDLDTVSLDTVRMFHDDAAAAGYSIDVSVAEDASSSGASF